MVEIRTVTEAPTAVVAWSTTWRAFRNEWQPALDEVWTVVREHDLRTDGHNVMLYHDDIPNVEVGVQVTRTFEAVGRVQPSVLPAGRAAHHLHRGPYSELDGAHVAVRDWSAQHGHRVTGCRWEIYGDWADDPARCETAVFWLLR